MDSILYRIKNSKLTKVERKIGEYILQNQEATTFMTSESLAQAVGVSNASIIRFSRSIGFSGYTDFKHALQQEQKAQYKVLSNDLTVPTDRLDKSSKNSSSEDFFYAHWETVHQNIQSIPKKNTFTYIDQAVNQILNGASKYIYASRSRSGLGEFMALILSHCLPDVHFVGSQMMTPFDYLADGKKEDVLLILSFPRYPLIDDKLIDMAKTIGMKVILITDSMNCPFTQKADTTLFVDVSSDTFFNSYSSTFFFIDYLCGLVSKRIGDQNKDKLNLINRYISDMKSF